MIRGRLGALSAILGFLIAYDGSGEALAQGGSTGGTIGKRDKAISGGEVEVRKTVKREREPLRSAARSLNGRWTVSQDCTQGRFEVELTIKHTSPTEFTGTSVGITTGAHSQITDGRLQGNRLTFSRALGSFSDRWTAQLTGPGRFSGSSAGRAWRCSYTAVRQ